MEHRKGARSSVSQEKKRKRKGNNLISALNMKSKFKGTGHGKPTNYLLGKRKGFRGLWKPQQS